MASKPKSTSTRSKTSSTRASSSRTSKTGNSTPRRRSTYNEPSIWEGLQDLFRSVYDRLHALTLDQRLDIIGVLLCVLGFFSILGFFYRGSDNMFGQWGTFLANTFGWMIYVVPLAVTLFGVWLILRRFERMPTITVERITGIFLFFLSFTIWVHFFALQTIVSPLAYQGGGNFGRFLANPLITGFGWLAALVINLCLTWLAILLTFDVPFARIWVMTEGARKQLKERFQGTFSPPTLQEERVSRKEEIEIPEDLPQIFRPISDISPGGPSVAIDEPITGIDKKENEPADEFSKPIRKPPDREWKLPDIGELLQPAPFFESDTSMVEEQARIIEETLDLLGAPGHVVEINHGPRVTQFGVEPDFNERRSGDKIRVRVTKLVSLADDLTMALASQSVRIQAPVPGKSYVGIEVPNADAEPVVLSEIISAQVFRKLHSPLRFGLGKDVTGRAVAANLKTMPHLLIAGTTGSGKSVCINAILCNLLLYNSPRDLRLLLVDPKRVELTGYNWIPHLLAPVVVEMTKVVNALQWILREMESRYHKFSKVGARNLVGFNQKNPKDYLPHIVVVIDELADLMMTAPGETEATITRLAQLARATGIHLILATQRPSTKVITGLIKANFPARIAFNVATGVDSRVILDQNGAERLLGKGDMLFKPPDLANPFRLQGVHVSDEEIDNIINYWKHDAHKSDKSSQQSGKVPPAEKSKSTDSISLLNAQQGKLWDLNSKFDPLTEEAVRLIREEQRASTTMLQRKLRIGYTRAARIIEHLYSLGIISEPHPTTQIREVLDWGEQGPPEMEEQDLEEEFHSFDEEE
jgi:S-DNA-T family DNA segregation ATPase FtsK/SpoIIIE